MMTVRRKPINLEAVQWRGEPNPKLEECSCHPGKRSMFSNGGFVWLNEGDWIITNPSTDDSWVLKDAEFKREYDIITS